MSECKLSVWREGLQLQVQIFLQFTLTKFLTTARPRPENGRPVLNSARILPQKNILHIFRNHDNDQRTYFIHNLQILS